MYGRALFHILRMGRPYRWLPLHISYVPRFHARIQTDA